MGHSFFFQPRVEIWGQTPKTRVFIYKKLCIYSYMFKLQSPSKYPPFAANIYWDIFSTAQQQFLNSSILMPFTASDIFCFTSCTSANTFPLRTFFIQGNKKKVAWGEIGWIGRVGNKGHAVFGHKVWAGGLVNHPSWNGQTSESLQQKFMEAEHSLLKKRQLVHLIQNIWYGGFLEHSPSGGSLYYKRPTL